MRRARRRDGCSAEAPSSSRAPKFRQRHVNAWTGALLVKNIQSHYPPLLSRHTAISTPPTCSYIVRRASAAPSPHISHPRTGTVEPLRRRADEQPENRLAESVHVVISIAKSPPERGAPLQGQPRPKGSSVDNLALHPLDLLGRDHGVEPREKLLALRLIIERARVLVLCAVR